MASRSHAGGTPAPNGAPLRPFLHCNGANVNDVGRSEGGLPRVLALVPTCEAGATDLSRQDSESLPRRRLVQPIVEADEAYIRWVLLRHGERGRQLEAVRSPQRMYAEKPLRGIPDPPTGLYLVPDFGKRSEMNKMLTHLRSRKASISFPS